MTSLCDQVANNVKGLKVAFNTITCRIDIYMAVVASIKLSKFLLAVADISKTILDCGAFIETFSQANNMMINKALFLSTYALLSTHNNFQ